MLNLNKLLIFLTALLLCHWAHALEMKEARLTVKLTEESSKKCGLSAASVEAQIETVLRSNSIKVGPSLNGPRFYFSLSAVEKPIGGCYGHGYLQVFTLIDSGNLGWTKQTRTGIFEHCLRTFAFSDGRGFEMQEKINSGVADLTRQCVSEIFKN